ncbi:hypothetical protein Gferi_13225 [Geosporobacter ferrireducens]|uniref:Uncharacterized protein n=1 Tax=Geosporobacter ferrireducens TaxID=1424294 RepID=A0A1D8GHS9_9FIRM|nr:hypothetical protein Gferi_13225 [Geosporobacter ferrireducens]
MFMSESRVGLLYFHWHTLDLKQPPYLIFAQKHEAFAYFFYKQQAVVMVDENQFYFYNNSVKETKFSLFLQLVIKRFFINMFNRL